MTHWISMLLPFFEICKKLALILKMVTNNKSVEIAKINDKFYVMHKHY